jgi:BirA family biotin operon repressor/biotin-[acetyl-CoA-carboxylase] ligase
MNIISTEELSSTNDYMQKLLSEEKELAEGTVVWAKHQTAGRGQGQNKWESEKNKNLTFSVLLYPDFLPVTEQFLLSQLTALGIIDFLANSCALEDVTVKWPNDIYWKDKKICGMLIENRLSGHTISHTILGIGININQEQFMSDAPNPVSVKQITGKEYDLEKILLLLRESILNRYLQLLRDEKEQIRTDYFNKLYRREGYHLYKDASGEFSARIKSIKNNGILVLETDTEERLYAFKEVSIVLGNTLL